ncbi:hypothetical protein [uncultured Tenacibaculum sp.]|uniref:hypothetical protein n=1 Tax=uncultured Tenacibaculum sp. TaxID=174713 RepID=UPI00262F27AE|nr:hypothetical protein [uncultured Tenacibaculum sp.]
MNFKAQPYLSKQCGQTCVAMITGKSIEDVCNEINKEYTTNIYTDLQKYLNNNGYKTFVAYGDFQFSEVPNNSIIRLNKPDDSGHFVVKNENGIIYDPSVGIVQKYMSYYTITHYLKFEKE